MVRNNTGEEISSMTENNCFEDFLRYKNNCNSYICKAVATGVNNLTRMERSGKTGTPTMAFGIAHSNLATPRKCD